jgi:hypothetical protein
LLFRNRTATSGRKVLVEKVDSVFGDQSVGIRWRILLGAEQFSMSAAITRSAKRFEPLVTAQLQLACAGFEPTRVT